MIKRPCVFVRANPGHKREFCRRGERCPARDRSSPNPIVFRALRLRGAQGAGHLVDAQSILLPTECYPCLNDLPSNIYTERMLLTPDGLLTFF